MAARLLTADIDPAEHVVSLATAENDPVFFPELSDEREWRELEDEVMKDGKEVNPGQGSANNPPKAGILERLNRRLFEKKREVHYKDLNDYRKLVNLSPEGHIKYYSDDTRFLKSGYLTVKCTRSDLKKVGDLKKVRMLVNKEI